MFAHQTVALNSDQLNAAGGYSSYPPSVCGRSISIQWGGKTISATIQDGTSLFLGIRLPPFAHVLTRSITCSTECPTCPYGGLDLSAGLFSAFASHDVGVIYGTWWYNDGSHQPEVTKEEPKWTPPATTSTTPAWTPPTTSSTPEWTPTTTWTPPAPTSTSTSSTPAYTPEPTSTSVASTSSVAASSSALSSSLAFGASSVLSSGGASAGASGSAARSGAAFTLSGAASAAASASGSASPGASVKGGEVLENNLEMIGSLVDLMGKTVCNANANCEA